MQNAPVTFQRMISQIVKGFKGCKAYDDDVIVHSETWQDSCEPYFQDSLKPNLQ